MKTVNDFVSFLVFFLVFYVIIKKEIAGRFDLFISVFSIPP